MSGKLTDGLMVGLAVGGVLALFATAEFGIPAAIVGATISAISGFMAIRRNDGSKRPTSQLKHQGLRSSSHMPHRKLLEEHNEREMRDAALV